MQLRQSERRQAKIKIALQAPSGAGKTYSALLLAYGLINDWNKIAIIDTENGSADLYAHLGEYQVLSIKPPYSPERYIQAIELCEKAKVECIIIDSISHGWDFLLDYHASLTGNSFTNWAKITPRQKRMIDKILQTGIHVIATMRTKQDYVLNQKDGKYLPEKVGLKAIQRDGVDYEFTTVFDIDINHFAKVSKDRTGMFNDQPEFIITPETGNQILKWCNSGVNIQDIKAKIKASKTLEELVAIYKEYPTWYNQLEKEYSLKKQMIQVNQNIKSSKTIQNGTTHN
ncbi:MAG: AAA family ATPase [Chitinophagales bacterium]